MKLSLDTNAYSSFLRGNPRLTKLVEEADEVYISATVLGELYAGFFRGERTRDNLDAMRTFLASPGVWVTETTRDIYERYGRLVSFLHSKGTPLPSNDVWVAGLEAARGAKRYDQADLTGALALVVGSEGSGLRRLVEEKCDFLVEMPMRGKISSLNAAVAGSIVLYDVLRQRQTA